MGLGYTHQSNPVVKIGSKSGTTRTGNTLESTYVAGNTATIAIGGMSKITFYFLYTMGAAESTNSIEVRIKTSPDGTNWYQLVNETVSAGTSTLNSREFTFVGVDASAASFVLPLDINDSYLQIAVKETGVAANKGSIFVETISGGEK